MEGKDGVYAEAYAEATTKLQNNMFDKYTDRVKEKFAQLYAEKRYEGKDRGASAHYAMTYCDALPDLEKHGKDEAYIHSFTKHSVFGRKTLESTDPGLDPSYVHYFCTMYGVVRADGGSMKEAIVKAELYAVEMAAKEKRKN